MKMFLTHFLGLLMGIKFIDPQPALVAPRQPKPDKNVVLK
jgi:hypothetical protein